MILKGFKSMAEFDRMAATTVGTQGRAAEIDQGLRAHMTTVYNYLSGGLFVAAGTAYVFGNVPVLAQAVWGSPLKWAVIFAPLALIFFMSFRLQKMSVGAVQATYWVFTLLMGVSLSMVFLRFAGDYTPIVQAFGITAVSFLGLSLYGYTTKRNLSGMGSFLLMGLIGLILASIANIFIASSALSFGISVIGVLIFAGLTAYDTQRIKNEYLYYAQAGMAASADLSKAAVMGALGLFLNFVNMFQFILSFMGGSE